MSANRQSIGAPKARRTHNKSRAGCRECKRRHIKCDEQRPRCVNCSVSGKHCEYAFIAAGAASASSPRPGAYIDRATSPALTKPERPKLGGPGIVDCGETFTLEHMQLLHHIEHGVRTWLGATESMVPLVEQYIETALTTPYLMDQLLALSALHLSYTSAHGAARYRSLATELQTRGLSQFRAVKYDSSGATARWYFSSLLAMHNLATTLAECHEREFDTFLDGLIRHMGLHQGTQTIGKGSWQTIRSGGLREWLDHMEESGSAASSPSDSDPSMFARILQTSRLNAASAEICWDASVALVHAREKIQGPNCWGPHAVLAWLNLISKEFINLLGERIPEALLILAYYAEMLHTFRDYWVFGAAGEYLIKGLVARLGASWTRWLKRPLAVLSEADPH